MVKIENWAKVQGDRYFSNDVSKFNMYFICLKFSNLIGTFDLTALMVSHKEA